MCDAGRIRHHLKHNLWREECTIVFVGFQAAGTLGRSLLDGIAKVKLFGEEIAVKAKIINFKGLSAHADKQGLTKWISSFDPKPSHVFVVHGEKAVSESFAQYLRELSFPAHAPDYGEVYDLLSNSVAVFGTEPVLKKSKPKETGVYAALLSLGEQLMEVIHRNKGGTNRDLKKFADQIRKLIEKWDR